MDSTVGVVSFRSFCPKLRCKQRRRMADIPGTRIACPRKRTTDEVVQQMTEVLVTSYVGWLDRVLNFFQYGLRGKPLTVCIR